MARILVPAAVAITLVALMTGGAWQIDSELHVVAPDQVARGALLPVRAHLYVGLRRPEGAELTVAPLAVVLRAGRRVLARQVLRAAHARTLEGAIALPPDFAGRAVLEAVAERGGERVYSERVLDVYDAATRAPALAWLARPLAPLQRFAPGPLRREPNTAAAPSALALQIEGGACVPERSCTLLAHVGEPGAALRVRPTPSVTPEAKSAEPSLQTSGVVALRVVTHGPEAELRISAERDGVQVATRAFRLEVALAASALAPLARVLRAPALPRLGLQDEEPGCIVDAYFEQRWERTGSLADCRQSEAIPFAKLTPGLWRLQLRRDPFASSSAAVASVYVRAAGEPDVAVLERLAAAALERDSGDALARAVRARPAAHAPAFADTARYLLAVLDAGVLALPEAVSGRPRALARRQAARVRVRKLALLVLALCALTLGAMVLQRGLSAAGEVSRVMAGAGEEPSRVDRQRMRITLRVLATVSSLLLLFAAIAAYVIARAAAP